MTRADLLVRAVPDADEMPYVVQQRGEHELLRSAGLLREVGALQRVLELGYPLAAVETTAMYCVQPQQVVDARSHVLLLVGGANARASA